MNPLSPSRPHPDGSSNNALVPGRSATPDLSQTLLRRLSQESAPDAGLQFLLDFALERGYLQGLADVRSFPQPPANRPATRWLEVQRLPIHPSRLDDYQLLPRWQNVLSTLHAWRHRMAYVLLRTGGQTKLYLGAVTPAGGDAASATAQLAQAASCHLPGMQLQLLKTDAALAAVHAPLMSLPAAGAVTGLPAVRRGASGSVPQTLDQVAHGVRDLTGDDRDYAVLLLADPIDDQQIANAIFQLRQLGGRCHSLAQRNESSTESTGEMKYVNFSLAALVGSVSSFIPAAPPLVGLLGGALGGMGRTHGTSQNRSSTVSRRQIDKVAAYCEQLTDKHIVRLQRGRSTGMWSVGAYVLADNDATVNTVSGILRSVYSGDETFVEPIRTHLLRRDSGATESILQFQPIQLPGPMEQEPSAAWHPLGSMYESVSTPLNTEELSIASSLPRKDAPGLRFNLTDVRFPTNPPLLDDASCPVRLGDVLDQGAATGMRYDIDIHRLVRHALITGLNGSGKSTTCRLLLAQIRSRGIPFLIIEPAKDEYVRWALQVNAEQPENAIQVFMPGVEQLEGQPLQPLRLNPFESAGWEQAPTADPADRCERLCAILNASLPMADILPTLLEEAVFTLMEAYSPPLDDAGQAERDREDAGPRLSQLELVAKNVVLARQYDQRTQQALSAALQTRLRFLTRGKRGSVLNAARSTPPTQLFDRPTVINLDRLHDDRDKSLIMALILMSLFEYRTSRFQFDEDYRRRANAGQLCHLTMVEEAHRLLRAGESTGGGAGNPRAVAAGMFSDMLSEFRAYGQGVAVVDQFPGRLIADAVKNTNYKIVHRLAARDDREAMAGCLGLRRDQEALIPALRVGQAIVSSNDDDAAAWVRVRPATNA